MNNFYLAVMVPGEFASKLKDMLWTAYGPLVKIVLCVLLVVVIGGPLLAFGRRLFR